jgi:hypothetical protein
MRPALLACALAFLLAVDGGCAHFAPAATTTPMVEVTDGSIVPSPPPPPPPYAPMTRRRALLITGGVLTAVGAVTTAIGLGVYVRGRADEASEDCAHSGEWLCGLGGQFEQGMGTGVMSVGIPHLAAGLIVIGFGAHEHR